MIIIFGCIFIIIICHFIYKSIKKYNHTIQSLNTHRVTPVVEAVYIENIPHNILIILANEEI
jgi:hypothetical protein